MTNCIKYAFDVEGGEILVKALLADADTISLSIKDNGRGLTGDFNLAETSSLWMEMMKALSKQLGGSFKISNDSSVLVNVIFKVETDVRNIIHDKF
jgi:two-component sensor histidine kinase